MTAGQESDPAARAATLREEIARANHEYDVLDAPTLRDAEYDRLFRELREIEADRKSWIATLHSGQDVLAESGPC